MLLERLLETDDGVRPIMEDRRSQCGIGLSIVEYFNEILGPPPPPPLAMTGMCVFREMARVRSQSKPT